MSEVFKIKDKEYVLKNFNTILKTVNGYVSKTIELESDKDSQMYRIKAIELLQNFVDCLELTDYLLIDSKPKISRDIYIDSYFTLGTLYKNYVEMEIKEQTDNLKKSSIRRTNENTVLSKENESLFVKAINSFQKILQVSFDDIFALKQITSICTQLCLFSQNDLAKCLQYLEEGLLYAPENETIHYNLGYIYQRLNKLELSLIHYKLAIKLTSELNGDEKRKLLLNSYNGISCI
jgi:tetratricopeptide (TPR) repeat protein